MTSGSPPRITPRASYASAAEPSSPSSTGITRSPRQLHCPPPILSARTNHPRGSEFAEPPETLLLFARDTRIVLGQIQASLMLLRPPRGVFLRNRMSGRSRGRSLRNRCRSPIQHGLKCRHLRGLAPAHIIRLHFAVIVGIVPRRLHCHLGRAIEF